MPETSNHIAAAVAQLQQRFGNSLSLANDIRDRHGRDESYHHPELPDAVLFAQSTEDVADAVKICAGYRLPVIPFGVGTSLEGQISAAKGGLSIDLSQMNAVLRVSPEDMDCTVQAGVTRKQLNEHLRDTGLFFPIDPGADASIGGMAATRASGTNAVRYGTMRDNVLGATVVMPDGKVIRAGGRARKSAAGYDLTRLFVGSEGTLGVMTEITLKLHGIPEAISAATCVFPDIGAAVRTCIATIQAGVPVARIELLDEVQVAACNSYSKLELTVAPTLLFEFHGTPRGVEEQAAMVADFAADAGGREFQWTATPEERTRLWQARHNAFYAAVALRPGCKGMSTDVCVPISQLAECIVATKNDLKTATIPAPLVGHVGDGNFHLCLVIDPNKQDEIDEAYAINDRLVARAIAMGGTCTGEHGVGTGKMRYLEAEFGPEALDVMRALKRALDPLDIMNPGKIVPL